MNVPNDCGTKQECEIRTLRADLAAKDEEIGRMREALKEVSHCGGGCCIHCINVIDAALKARPIAKKGGRR